MEFLKTLTAGESFISPISSLSSQRTPLPPCTLSSPLTAVHAAVVLEILCDELEAISATFAAPKPELRSTESIAFSKANRSKFTVLPKSLKGPRQFSLVHNYSTLIPRKMLKGLKEMRFWTSDDLQAVMAEGKVKTHTASGKYQRDRTFLQMTAENALQELLQTGTFHQLHKTIEDEKDALRTFWNTCLIIPREYAYIRQLKEELQQVKKSKWVKLKELDQEIFRLNDQLLEQDRRVHLEAKFVEKQVKMIVKRFKRRHRQVVQENNETLAVWQKKLCEEDRVHSEMMAYLRITIERVNDLLMHWQEKYERDLTQLVTTIEEMVENRLRDQDRSDYIYSVIARHEPIVIDERRLSVLGAQKQQRKERENLSSVKIQAWWRGTMVRKELGPFNRSLASETAVPVDDFEHPQERTMYRSSNLQASRMARTVIRNGAAATFC
ncbi:hypothetical protein RRG08_016621 [Elysia crispata]|uniref:Dynein regulatory complex protein 9 n=1 Tax=Elysia crispata TaxID=231223 RepID=A0AAE0YH07_9GAST|nr:hypothetical protein RRG08_016621 [Elysia crispata]